MRELAKSLFSFSWGSMVFGTRRILDSLQPKGTCVGDGAGTSSQAGGDVFDRTFRAGDTLQRGVVDMMFGCFTPSALNPAWWVKGSADVIRRSTSAFQQASSGAASGASSSGPCPQSTGWGPVN